MSIALRLTNFAMPRRFEIKIETNLLTNYRIVLRTRERRKGEISRIRLKPYLNSMRFIIIIIIVIIIIIIIIVIVIIIIIITINIIIITITIIIITIIIITTTTTIIIITK